MREVKITRGYVAIVDDQDYERVSQHRWQVLIVRTGRSERTYAKTAICSPGVKQRTVLMHRYILGCRENVDHWDGNGLNNTRGNLRPASQSCNVANSRKRPRCASEFKGVTRNGNQWEARIVHNYRTIRLGRFQEETEAAKAYNAAAKEIFGEFARLNVIAA